MNMRRKMTMNNEEKGLELTDKNRLEIILEIEKNMSNNWET